MSTVSSTSLQSIKTDPIQLALYGGSGRMGKYVQDLIKDQELWNLKIVCNRYYFY